MDPRAKAWTAAILAGSSLWGLHLLRGFLELAHPMAGRYAGFIRASIGALIVLVTGLLILLALGWRRLSLRHWDGLAALLFVVLAVAPAIGKTAGRLILGPDRMTLDAILQVEVAADLLARGKNPYSESYVGTDLERWNRGASVPSMYHLVYPPFPILLTLPLRELAVRTVGAYDSRFLLIPVLVATFLLAWSSWKGLEWRAALLALAFLNPLQLSDFHVGRWDTLILLLWTFALRAASSGRPAAMAAWLALGALTKTTLLATALVGVAYACRTRREALRWGAVFGTVFLALFLPFFLWNPRDMYLDLFGATQGIGPHPFPIDSVGPFGFANVVLALGWASSPEAYFPFWILQIPTTLSAAALSVRRLLDYPSLTRMATGFALIAGLYMYFNRYSYPSWYGALFSMVVLAVGYDRARPRSPEAAVALSP